MGAWFSTDRANERGQLFQSLGSDDEAGIRTVLDQVDWTPDAIQDLQDSVLSNNGIYVCFVSEAQHLIKSIRFFCTKV